MAIPRYADGCGQRKKKRTDDEKFANEEASQVVDFGGLRAPGLQRWLKAFVDGKGQIRSHGWIRRIHRVRPALINLRARYGIADARTVI